MDLLRPGREQFEAVVSSRPIDEPSCPIDELTVAEIGHELDVLPHSLAARNVLLRWTPGVLTASTTLPVTARLRSALRLPGRALRGPTSRLPRTGLLALAAVTLAAVVLVRPGGAGGAVLPAGATSALLTTSDLGTSWSDGGLTFDLGAVPTAAYDPSALAHGSCGRTAADPTADAVSARTSNFNSGNRFMSDTLGVFPSATVAHERYAAYRAALAACRQWTATTSDGGQLALRLEPLHSKDIGDESGAYRMTGEVSPAKTGLPQSTAIEAAVVVSRRLNALSVVAEMSIGYLGQGADARTSDAILAASAADSKLARLATVAGPLQMAAGAPPQDASNGSSSLARSTTPGQNTDAPIGSPQVLEGNDGSKVAVTVLQVTDPATGQDGYIPKPGNRYVGVQIRLGNVGTAPYDDSPENGAILVDDHGEQHYADLAEITAGGGFGGHVTLGAEDARTGYIVFQLPQGLHAHLLQFALDSGFGPSMGQWALDGSPQPTGQPSNL
jgi:hypothetical protein